MIIKHASHILRGNGRRQGTYIRHYISFAISRKENGLLDLGDHALPLLLEASEKLLELPCLLDFLMLFGSLSVHLELLVLLLWDLLQSHHDGILQIYLTTHV
jgi:hypothetical protein